MNPDEERNCRQNMLKRLFLAGLVAACVCSLGISDLAEAAPSTSRTLEASFKNPPDSARIWVYWFWLNGNITRGGITADLEAMKRAGVGGVLIMEVDQGTRVGPVAFMSDRWRELFKHMVAEAHRLGIEVNMNNDAGWNGSGGPWVPLDQAMQVIVTSEKQVQGGKKFEGELPMPRQNGGFYRDIAVLAFPTPADPTNPAYRITNLKGKGMSYGWLSGRIKVGPDVPAESVISKSKIVDLTAKMDASGKLLWDAPSLQGSASGEWTVVRFGHTFTGKMIHPAPKTGIGPECDKLSKEAIETHYNGMIAKLVKDVGPLAGKSFVATHVDSCEHGAQNWTPKMREEFKRLRGYDMMLFMPVMTGRIVDSVEISERFLRDVRQTVSDLLVENYIGHLRKLANRDGLRLSMESYRTPANDLDVANYVDEPICEFWWPDGSVIFWCVKSMASIAHVNGRPIVGGEAFTAGPKERRLAHPATLKALGDRAFCDGVNRFIVHRYAMQPWVEERRPGMTMGPYGQHYERSTTWWEDSTAWHQYVARCQYMLRQGTFVADVLWLQSEEPMMRMWEGLELPGYDYDSISPQAFLKLAGVKNGMLELSSGMKYRLLVLPKGESSERHLSLVTLDMTPKMLDKIRDLVEDGATVVGRPPVRAPGLSGYPASDEKLLETVKELWGSGAPAQSGDRKAGKGRVVWGKPVPEVLAAMGVLPDFASSRPLRHIHRDLDGMDIYFVANPDPLPAEAVCTFRVSSKTPEAWFPDTGRIEPISVFEETNGCTRIPLRFEPAGSMFIVFKKGNVKASERIVSVKRNGQELVKMSETDAKSATGDVSQVPPLDLVNREISQNGTYEIKTADEKSRQVAVTDMPAPQEIKGPWEVKFAPGLGAPERIVLDDLVSWSRHSDSGVRYFSGSATYRKLLELPQSQINSGKPEVGNLKSKMYLDLGKVAVMAEVKLNGKNLPILWKAPYSVDITDSVKAGENDLEIRVVNLPVNRMIGDEFLPEDSERNKNGTLRKWPQWLEQGKPSPTGRFTFTSWRLWKKDEPLQESGLLGPVTVRTVMQLPSLGSTLLPTATSGAVESDLYAYYTRLDYQIPLSEIDMDVPFSNAEHIRTYWAHWKPRVAPAIPTDAPRPKNPILKIGAASPNFGGMFGGNIDHVGIYNRKLGRDDLARLAAGKAVDAALVANYRFNRSMADSAGGKSALAHGRAEFSSDSREGSHSLQLDGRAMWMELPVETQANQSFTWSAWIKTSGEGTVIAHCNRSGPWHAHGRCLYVRNGNLTFDIGWVGSVKHPADISDGRWHHVAVAAGPKLIETDLYVDGKCSPGGPPITGKHADIVVHIDENRRLVFGRETSYCPWLETPAGRFPFKPLVACKPDPMCLSAYVRIIKNEPDEVLIHWCHVPDPDSIVITEKIHELFAVSPDGRVVRQVKVGTQRLEDFQDPANRTVQTLQLTEAGFKELSLSKPELSGKPSEAVDGRPVRKTISASPAAWLKFDEGLRTRAAAQKQKTEESVGGTVCTLSGNKALWKRGVSGTALAFDGYFSKVTLPGKKAPRLTDELTLEAWVVLGAYPWNDAGIVHQSAGEPITAEAYKHGYTDPYVYRPWKMKGYLLGIDPYGRPMFKVGGRQVGGGEVQHKETVSTEHVIPTYRWVHLAGVYGNGSMSLYMDGKLIEERPASGVIEVPDRDVLVGLNGDAQRISDPVSHSDFAANNNLPIVYGIEGLIDEVKIYDRALSVEQIRQSYRAFLPPAEGVDNPRLERRILPGEVTGRPASKFGATYTTLEYHELWDNLWRPSSYRDIVVRFDALPTTVVFWQGPNFGSGWVTENNRWMSDQSCEMGGPHGCAEHMSDKRGRFGRVRLIENTDARVVIHWRYPSIDVGYVFPTPDVWADEYYTIYPDGVGIRHVARAPSGWHDIQILTQAGTTCLDNISLTALTVANLDGESAELTWEPPNHPPDNPIKDACIKVVNFKSDWKVFVIYREGAQIETWGRFEQSKHTPDPFPGPWNHWPVGLNPSDGRYAVSHDRVTHASIGYARRVGNFIMYGFTDKSATSLIPLAKAWNHPPTLTNLEGCESRGYRQTERAYILASKASSMSFTLNGSEKTPVYNPCFAIENWTSENKSRLVVNGIEMESGKSFRQGITRDANGTMTLVVWVELESVSPVRFAVEDGEG